MSTPSSEGTTHKERMELLGEWLKDKEPMSTKQMVDKLGTWDYNHVNSCLTGLYKEFRIGRLPVDLNIKSNVTWAVKQGHPLWDGKRSAKKRKTKAELVKVEHHTVPDPEPEPPQPVMGVDFPVLTLEVYGDHTRVSHADVATLLGGMAQGGQR